MGCSVLQAELEQRSQSSHNLQGESEQASHHHVPLPAPLSVCLCTLSVPFFKLWDLTPLLAVVHRLLRDAAPHVTSNNTSWLQGQVWGLPWDIHKSLPIPVLLCQLCQEPSPHSQDMGQPKTALENWYQQQISWLSLAPQPPCKQKP